MTERRKLLEAAEEVFSEVGIAQSSLQMIADRAGLDCAVARCLFVDKITLLRELLEEYSSPLLSAISMAVERIEEPRKMIRESLRLFDDWLDDHPTYVRIIQRCMLDDPESLKTIYERSMYPSEFYERIEEYIRAGKIRSKDPMSFMFALDSLIIFPHIVGPSLDSLQVEDSHKQTSVSRFESAWDLIENGLF